MAFKSKLEMEDAVFVHIIGRRRAKAGPGDPPGMRFERAEDDLLGEFLQFLCDHAEEVEGIGGSTSGLGNYSGTFTAESKPYIEEFFRSKGLLT